MTNIDILGEKFQLHHSGAAYWKNQEMLLVADVHLGKVSHFRKHGSAVPLQAIQRNFKKLQASIDQFQPKVICFLGDLFHSALNLEWNLFETWIKAQKAEVFLVAGNHDIISPIHFEDLGVKVFDELVINGFLLTHHPTQDEGFFNICGHLHPGYRLSGLARQHLKLKCFFKSEIQLILPAFGEFTGCYLMKPTEKEHIFVCTKSEVILVT